MDNTFEGLEVFRHEKPFGVIEKVINGSVFLIRMRPGKAFKQTENLVVFVSDDKKEMEVQLKKTEEHFVLEAELISSESILKERKYKRIEMEVTVHVDHKDIPAKSIDISQGGMKFTLNRAITKGKMVSLKFVIDEHLYEVNAIIVNLKKIKVGFRYNVEFTNMSEEDKKYIRASLYGESV